MGEDACVGSSRTTSLEKCRQVTIVATKACVANYFHIHICNNRLAISAVFCLVTADIFSQNSIWMFICYRRPKYYPAKYTITEAAVSLYLVNKVDTLPVKDKKHNCVQFALTADNNQAYMLGFFLSVEPRWRFYICYHIKPIANLVMSFARYS